MSNHEQKQFNLDVLRKAYVTFMDAVAKMPGAILQKQQAFYRFDEGHMWMQNAVLTYVEPQAPAEPVAPQELEVQVVDMQESPVEQPAEQAPSESPV
jgi:hypothetical protein